MCQCENWLHLSSSEEDISRKCDHDNDYKKAIIATSYYVPDMNHKLEIEGGDCSNVKNVFQLTLSKDDISPRDDYGADSNKEIITAKDYVQDSDYAIYGDKATHVE